jgi:hypothetical protein
VSVLDGDEADRAEERRGSIAAPRQRKAADIRASGLQSKQRGRGSTEAALGKRMGELGLMGQEASTLIESWGTRSSI